MKTQNKNISTATNVAKTLARKAAISNVNSTSCIILYQPSTSAKLDKYKKHLD